VRKVISSTGQATIYIERQRMRRRCRSTISVAMGFCYCASRCSTCRLSTANGVNIFGGRAAAIGRWHTPYAILSGDREALRLSCFGRDCVFVKSNILSLRKVRSLSSMSTTGVKSKSLLHAIFW
jgi:hypothetical protein